MNGEWNGVQKTGMGTNVRAPEGVEKGAQWKQSVI